MVILLLLFLLLIALPVIGLAAIAGFLFLVLWAVVEIADAIYQWWTRRDRPAT